MSADTGGEGAGRGPVAPAARPATRAHAPVQPADPLARVTRELSALDDAPVAAHPDMLEAVHRAVVDELERLSGVGAPDGERGRGVEG